MDLRAGCVLIISLCNLWNSYLLSLCRLVASLRQSEGERSHWKPFHTFLPPPNTIFISSFISVATQHPGKTDAHNRELCLSFPSHINKPVDNLGLFFRITCLSKPTESVFGINEKPRPPRKQEVHSLEWNICSIFVLFITKERGCISENEPCWCGIIIFGFDWVITLCLISLNQHIWTHICVSSALVTFHIQQTARLWQMFWKKETCSLKKTTKALSRMLFSTEYIIFQFRTT